MAPRSRRGRRGWRWRRCRPSNGATPPPFRVFYNYIHFFSFVFCCFSFFFFFLVPSFTEFSFSFITAPGWRRSASYSLSSWSLSFLQYLRRTFCCEGPAVMTHVMDLTEFYWHALVFFVFSSFLPPLILSAFSDEWVHSFYWLVEAGYIGLTCSITTFISLPLNGRFVHYFFSFLFLSRNSGRGIVAFHRWQLEILVR